jgi:hypothetical protein
MTGDSRAPISEEMEWTVCLRERAPQKRWAVILVGLVGAAIGYGIFGNILVAIVAFVCIAASSSVYMFPLHYRLTKESARVRCGINVTEIDWNSVKRVIEGSGGVKLSPLASDSRLAPFRGVYLRYADNREAVLDYVKRYGGESDRLLEQGTDR